MSLRICAVRWQRLTALAILLAVATAVAGCDEDKPKFTLKEVINVQGTCAEDHVGKQDHYGGQIVRWQSVETGAVSTYGVLSKPFSSEAILDEATHPTTYHMYPIAGKTLTATTRRVSWRWSSAAWRYTIPACQPLARPLRSEGVRAGRDRAEPIPRGL